MQKVSFVNYFGSQKRKQIFFITCHQPILCLHAHTICSKALNFNNDQFVQNVYDNTFSMRKFCNNMTRWHWVDTATLGRTAIFTNTAILGRTATLGPHKRKRDVLKKTNFYKLKKTLKNFLLKKTQATKYFWYMYCTNTGAPNRHVILTICLFCWTFYIIYNAVAHAGRRLHCITMVIWRI